MIKIFKFLERYLEESICVVLMTAIALVLGLQVFMRYCMHSSLGWSEEFARYCFVWLVFIGISYGAREMKHITIDAFLYLFPKFLRRYVIILGQILFLIFSVWIVYLAWGFVQKQLIIKILSSSMRIPMWIVYLAPVVGFSLTTLRVIQQIVYTIKHPVAENHEEE